jgi:nitrile hydratase beta subunit
MNSIHDMGGMQNMGRIAPEKNEPVFHAEWERRVFALDFAVDETNRYEIELIPPADYLRMSYYEKWLVSLIETLKKIGVVTSAEIESGKAIGGPIKGRHVLSLAELAKVTAPGFDPGGKLTATARFQVGARVRARNINPLGHTRLPRFARGKLGVIERDGSIHHLQDTDAQGHSEEKPPQHVYCVRFTARELWGEQANPRDSVYVDLWEDYLEAA